MKKTLIFPVFILMIMNSCHTKEQSKPFQEEGNFSNALTADEIKMGVFTPELLWKFGRVADLQLSPDGTRIIYAVTRYDAASDKKHTWIFRVPVAGGEVVNLTEDMPSCSNPRWISNDLIGFLCRKDDFAQIWTMDANGNNKKVASETGSQIGGFEFSADGKTLLYFQDVKMDSSTQDMYPDLPLAKGIIIDDLMYRHWDSWNDYAYMHLFVSSLENDKIQEGTDILKGEPYDSPLPPYFNSEDVALSNDGRYIAYSCKKLKGRAFAESTNSDIYLYDRKSGTTVNITEGMSGYDRYPVFSPDSRKIAFMSMETPGFESDKERLFVYDMETGNKKYMTEKFDQNATHVAWSDDGNSLYFISGIQATYQIYEVNLQNASFRQITQGWHDYSSIAYSNGVLVGSKASMKAPAEIYKIDAVTGSETQLTFTNKNIYDVIKTAAIEQRWIETTDHRQMLVWVIFPPDFDSLKTYPALLYCQGGPQSAVSQNFSFRWNMQLMAAKGYIIIAPNRRGLPTFGSEWNNQISGDYGGQNIKDYLSAVDALKKEPYIDENSLGAVGASYGGYSVLYLAGHHQKRFKAFIAHCGMFNLESQAAGTEEMFFVHHDLGGYYWDQPKPVSYSKFSPHLYVDKWDTPIMLITGMNDFRIPYTESLQAFNVAQLRGIPSKLLVFPDENHWVTKPQNSLLWQREFFGWLDQWLKP